MLSGKKLKRGNNDWRFTFTVMLLNYALAAVCASLVLSLFITASSKLFCSPMESCGVP